MSGAHINDDSRRQTVPIMDPVAQSQAVVAVWRNMWLPPSETFIRNQVQALTKWTPYPLGLTTVPDGIMRPAGAPFDRLGGHGFNRPIVRNLFIKKLDHLLRASNAQLVHAHFGPDAVRVLPRAESAQLPLLVTFHGYDVTVTGPPSRERRRYRAALRRVFDYATGLIAVSDFIAGRLLALGAPENKVVVHQIGIPIAPRPLASFDDRSGVAFVGRLVEKKGVKDLIHAYARLPKELREHEPLMIVGSGPLEGQLRDMALRYKIAPQFYGTLDSTQVQDLLGRARVFCAPSRTASNGDSEGFGMVFLEAALASLPVVSYNHGGVPEAVAHGTTGLLATEGDVDELGDHLKRLLLDRDLAQTLGTAGRERVQSRFDIRERTAALEAIYDAAIARPSA
jgi:colanic acid/amylovoran biosynthesis glycosyltransferase